MFDPPPVLLFPSPQGEGEKGIYPTAEKLKMSPAILLGISGLAARPATMRGPFAVCQNTVSIRLRGKYRPADQQMRL